MKSLNSISNKWFNPFAIIRHRWSMKFVSLFWDIYDTNENCLDFVLENKLRCLYKKHYFIYLMHYNESINHQLNVIFKVKKRLAHILHYGKARWWWWYSMSTPAPWRHPAALTPLHGRQPTTVLRPKTYASLFTRMLPLTAAT